jgi:hypothetical protein
LCDESWHRIYAAVNNQDKPHLVSPVADTPLWLQHSHIYTSTCPASILFSAVTHATFRS